MTIDQKDQNIDKQIKEILYKKNFGNFLKNYAKKIQSSKTGIFRENWRNY